MIIVPETLILLERKSKKLPHLGPKAALTFERRINPLDEYWILHAQEVLMTLPVSGQLSLDDIRLEIGLAQTNVSLGSMSDTAGFLAPDQVSDFYGYTHSTSSSVDWAYPVPGGADYTVSSAKYQENGGALTNYFSDRVNTVDGTVGGQLNLNVGGTGAGGQYLCGSTDGGGELGGFTNGGVSALLTWTLSGISTTGNNIWFTDTIA